MTVRDLVREAQREMQQGDMAPGRAAELLPKLTALMGNVADEQRHADAAYAQVYLVMLEKHGKANRARIEAETTSAYLRKREAKDTGVLLEQMVMSLKTLIKYGEAELRGLGSR